MTATATAGPGTAASSRRRAVLGTVLWAVALAALVVANLCVLVPAFTTVRLWEDEAFNLTVPLNLLRGLGYTSDGTLSGSELTPFDVRISTGPVMLLPAAGLMALGIDPVVAGRLVGLAGYALLLTSLALVGRRLGGRWAALAAAAVPLAYAADALPSPIQTPVDLLGEVTAAGFLAAALLALHRRPWLAGLLVGLAMQTKFIALLALPAFAVAALLDAAGPGLRARIRRTWRGVAVAAACALAPTLLFEVTKLIALGPAGWLQNQREFTWFLRDAGQQGYRVAPGEKLAVFAGAWHLPGWLVAALIATGLALAVVGAVAVARAPRLLGEVGRSRAGVREFAVVVGAAALGVLVYLGWWLVSSYTPAWLRHPAPAVLAFGPVLVAGTIALGRVALGRVALGRVARGSAGGRVALRGSAGARRALAIVCALAGVAALTVSIWGRIADPGYIQGETLAQQRVAAADVEAARIAAGADRIASPWGAEVSIVVLSGAHSGLVDAGESVRRDLQLWTDGRGPASCDPLATTGRYVLCPPPG